jgi:hypothetical protein
LNGERFFQTDLSLIFVNASSKKSVHCIAPSRARAERIGFTLNTQNEFPIFWRSGSPSFLGRRIRRFSTGISPILVRRTPVFSFAPVLKSRLSRPPSAAGKPIDFGSPRVGG